MSTLLHNLLKKKLTFLYGSGARSATDAWHRMTSRDVEELVASLGEVVEVPQPPPPPKTELFTISMQVSAMAYYEVRGTNGADACEKLEDAMGEGEAHCYFKGVYDQGGYPRPPRSTWVATPVPFQKRID